MSDQSSCRPDRLLTFDGTTQAMADGMQRRAGSLRDAVGTYLAGCDSPFVVPCDGVVTPVDRWRGDLRAFGSWTGAVGRAFAKADEVDAFVDGPPQVVVGADEDLVATSLGRFHGRFDAIDPDTSPDTTSPGEVPADHGSNSGRHPIDDATLATTVGTRARGVARVGESAVDELGGTVDRIGTALNLAASALAVGGGAHSQWERDQDLSPGARATRTATRAAGHGVSSVLGAIAVDAIADAACGPLGPVCAVTAAPEASELSDAVTDDLVDKLPWMRPVHFDPSDPNLRLVRREVAADGEPVGADAEFAVGLAAGTVAEDVLNVEDPATADHLADVEERSGTEHGYYTSTGG